MKSSLLITLLAVLIFSAMYAVNIKSSLVLKTYNWNLELTKPVEYDIYVQDLTYRKDGKEIVRHTSMNNFTGWAGTAGSSVLHSTAEAHLPDSIYISWIETDTDVGFSAKIPFPKEMATDLWERNYKMQQEKWGKDYQKGALSLKLGLAPDGIMNLWLNDLDINTSGFSMEIASHKAVKDGDSMKPIDSKYASFNTRYGRPHFYTFQGENVVSIYITYVNGETNTISLKNTSGSILEEFNNTRGWAVARDITVVWFDKEKQGYRSTYAVDISELQKEDFSNISDTTQLIYLLDRSDSPEEEWHKFANSYMFHLTEENRKAF